MAHFGHSRAAGACGTARRKPTHRAQRQARPCRSQSAAHFAFGSIGAGRVAERRLCGIGCGATACRVWLCVQPTPLPPMAESAAALQASSAQPPCCRPPAHACAAIQEPWSAAIQAHSCCSRRPKMLRFRCMYSSEHRCRAGEHSGSRGTRCAPAPLLQYAVSASGRMCACACIGHGRSGARRTRNAAQRYANDAAKQQAPPCDVRSGSASLLQLRGHAARCGVCATALNALNALT
jgi:hypothetical protein